MIRVSHASALLGGIMWLWFFSSSTLLSPDAAGSFANLRYPNVRLILLLNALVIIPLLLPLVRVFRRDGTTSLLYRMLVIAQAPAALCLAISLTRTPGEISAWLSFPWLLFTGLMAMYGVSRFLPRNTGSGPARFSEACIDAGLVYLPVGSYWLSSFQFGHNPLGFNDTWTILTAAHFHYAAFVAPIWVGLTGRALIACDSVTERVWRIHPVAALIVIPGPLITALGITFSSVLEAFAAAALALALGGVALLNIFVVAPRFPGEGGPRRLGRVLLVVSSAALLFGMTLAVLFALGRLTGRPLFESITIPFMIRFHGWMNSAAFALLAMVAWTLLRPLYTGAPPVPPFSRLRSLGTIGSDFFERKNLLDTTNRTPRGLTDSLDIYAGLDFEPDRVAPAIREFYENTNQYDLLVIPRWHKGFRRLSRVYKFFSSRMGQMNFPVAAQSPEDKMGSRIFSLSDEKDGRTDVRAWVRVFESTGKPIYAAAYSSHRFRERTYMNIAFPHLFGNMTSLLRLESWGHAGLPGSVELSTLPPPLDGPRLGDEGIYYILPFLAIRLPFDERIRVWTRDDPAAPERLSSSASVSSRHGHTDGPNLYRDAALVAEHDMWLWGFKFLTLDYFMGPTRD